jgi:hypothetical protein
MRTRPLLFVLASLTLSQATLAETYYNPANPASNTGVTTGTDLYKTIGCPGSGLLEKTCDETVQPVRAVIADIPVIPATLEQPAQVEVVAAPVVVDQQVPAIVATAPVVNDRLTPAVNNSESSVASVYPNSISFEECYSQISKQINENLRNSANIFNFAAAGVK